MAAHQSGLVGKSLRFLRSCRRRERERLLTDKSLGLGEARDGMGWDGIGETDQSHGGFR
jgi:hypothetical protein